MIVFKKIRYKNFLSTGQQFIEIDLNKSNATLVVGENGAGKSTMLDALCFGLFQRAFRAIKKDQLINSINEKECVVEVEFTIGKKDYKIIRGIKPNIFEIWCNGDMLNQDAAQRDYQKHLESVILKLNFRSFTQVVILGNASFVPFMQLRARHRRQVVEEILDIEIFSKMNLLFREKQKSQDELIKQTDFNYQMVDSKIDDKKNYIDDIGNRSKDLVDSKKLEVKKSLIDIENYEEDIRKVKTEIAGLQKEILDATKINAKHQKLHTMEAKLENTCNKHKKDLRFFESHDDCPTCQQVIDNAFKTTMIDKKKDKVIELDSALGQIEKEIKTTEMKLDNVNKTMVLIREKELLINRYETSITEINKQKEKIQQEIDGLSNENQSTAVQTGELNQLQEQLTDLEKDKISQKEEMVYIDTARHLMQDTGIKTKIIKQYLPIMNQFINKNLADMDFFVNFSLDEEFNETIKSRHRDEFNYHSFSEGEKLRIDLAILFTWREIAKLKNSTNTNLLILDEIFDSSLDTSGTDEFMRILKTTMDKENVFVISHKGDTLIDKFPRVMKFEKYKNFTRMAE
ncbi:MAG: AAA family ATPase [Candidatus Pelagibacterales bacterium]|tara:strand:- start:770 stop:2485 length:1716 start_codon:yes stop_codon:yes gene_type:complete